MLHYVHRDGEICATNNETKTFTFFVDKLGAFDGAEGNLLDLSADCVGETPSSSDSPETLGWWEAISLARDRKMFSFLWQPF